MKQIEFSVKSKPELKFRTGKISAVELLALQTQIDFENMKQTTTIFNFILEHTEVQIGGQWVNVKEKNLEVYYPVGIEDDIIVLQEIIFYFLTNILKPIFMKSNESSHQQQ